MTAVSNNQGTLERKNLQFAQKSINKCMMEMHKFEEKSIKLVIAFQKSLRVLILKKKSRIKSTLKIATQGLKCICTREIGQKHKP